MALFQRFRPTQEPASTDSRIDGLIACGHFGQARDLLRRAAAATPDLDAARTFRRLAQCEREIAGYDAALTACHTGLRLLEQVVPSNAARLEQVRLLAAEGQTLIEAGRVDEAEAPLRQALQLSPPDQEVEGALALRSLGEISSARARHGEAEDLYARAMNTLHRLLPAVHRERGHAVNSWGLAALAQGRVDQAEERIRRGLELRTAMLEAGHPDIGESTHNLAAVMLRRGRLDDAEALDAQALRLWEKTLGPGHPRLGVALGNLGAIAQKRGRFAEADGFYRRTLELREAALGPQHPRLIPALNNIASIQFRLHRYDEAEALFRRTLALARSVHGEQHPDVARALNNLHSVLNALGRREGGEDCLRQAIAIWEATLGPDHKDLATSLTNLAGYQAARGDHDAAEATLLRSLQITAKQVGEDHPDLGTPLNNLANLYVGAGRLDQAEALYLRAQDLRRRAGYALSPETFVNLAEIARRQGRHADQYDYLGKAIDVVNRTLGVDRRAAAPQLVTYHRAQAHALRQLDDRTGALKTLRAALAIGERGGVDAVSQAATLTSLGVELWAAGEVGEAETVYRRGIALLERADNPEPGRLVELLVLLGSLLVMTGRAREALPVLERAHALATDTLGPDHELTGSPLVWLGYASLALGDAAEAERYLIGSFGQADQAPHVSASRATVALHGLRRLYRTLERPDELTGVLQNLVELRIAQGASDREMAGLLRELGDCHFNAAHYREAAGFFARVIDADTGRFSAAFRGSTAFYHALCLAQLGEDTGAHTQFAAATEALRGVDGTGHALALAIWIEFLVMRGRVEEVARLLPELARVAQTPDFRPETIAEVHHALGMAHALQQRWPDAEAALHRSLRAWEDPAAGETAGLNAMMVRLQLARLAVAQGRSAEAEAALRDVIARFETAGPSANRPLAAALTDLAQLLETQERAGEAETLRNRARSLPAPGSQ